MSQTDSGAPVLLITKTAGMLMLVAGCALTAAGVATEYNEIAAAGIVLLAIGSLLLVLKIMRRNQP